MQKRSPNVDKLSSPTQYKLKRNLFNLLEERNSINDSSTPLVDDNIDDFLDEKSKLLATRVKRRLFDTLGAYSFFTDSSTSQQDADADINNQSQYYVQ